MKAIEIIILIILTIIVGSSAIAGWSPPCMGAQCLNGYHSPVHLIPMNETSGTAQDINTTQTGNITTSGGYGFSQTGTEVFININRNSTTGDTGWSRGSTAADTNQLNNASSNVARFSEGTFCASFYLEEGSIASNDDFFTVGDAANDGKQLGIYVNTDQFAWGNWDVDNNFAGQEGLGCVSVEDESWYSVCVNWTNTGNTLYINNTFCSSRPVTNNGENGVFNAPSGEPGVNFNTYADASGESINVTVGYATWWTSNSDATNDIIGYYHRGDWPRALAEGPGAATINLSLPSPLNDTQYAVNDINLNVSANLSYAATQAELYINGTLNSTSTSTYTAGQEVLVSFNVTFPEGDYDFFIQVMNNSNAVNSTNSTFFVDTVSPTILWYYPSNIDNVSIYNITINASVNDNNLFKVNLSVFYSNNTLLSNVQYDSPGVNLSVYKQFNFTAQDNYTITLEALDSHTFGSLHDLTYTIDNKGVTFQKGSLSKRIFFGYYNGGGFKFLTNGDINNYGVSTSIVERRNEYSWHLNYIKPAFDVKFGFAIPKSDNLYLIDSKTGHFVWYQSMSEGWYFDFQDVVDTGSPLTYLETNDYHVLYTNSLYCFKNAGEKCKI